MHPALLIAIIVPAPFVVFFCYWLLAEFPWRKVPKDTAGRVAELLSCDPPSKLRDFVMNGQRNGVPVDFHAIRETEYYVSNKGHVSWRTKVEVSVDLRHVRLQVTQKMWSRGDVAGIQLGDEDFDKMYLVKGAPEETIREVFSAEVRKFFLQIPGGSFIVEPEGILYQTDSWNIASGEAEAIVEGLSLLTANLSSARKADLSKIPEVGGPFRSQPNFKEAERIESSRRDEIKDWDLQETRRAMVSSKVLRVGSIVIVLLALSFVIALYVGLYWP